MSRQIQANTMLNVFAVAIALSFSAKATRRQGKNNNLSPVEIEQQYFIRLLRGIVVIG